MAVETRTPSWLNTASVVQALEVHSHNTMNAFWSSVDDADEIWPGVFMVIGNLDKDEETCAVRAGYNGLFTPLDKHDIFES